MGRTARSDRENAEQLFVDAEQLEERGDLDGAFNCHLAAAKLGSVMSQLALGNFYSAGRGVQKDLQEAARWYKKVYRSGLSAGAVNLSVDLENAGNMRGAIAWLKRAVALSDGDACVKVAKIYLKRRRGAKTAASYLRRALSLSCADFSDDAREQAEALIKSIEKRDEASMISRGTKCL